MVSLRDRAVSNRRATLRPRRQVVWIDVVLPKLLVSDVTELLDGEKPHLYIREPLPEAGQPKA